MASAAAALSTPDFGRRLGDLGLAGPDRQGALDATRAALDSADLLSGVEQFADRLRHYGRIGFHGGRKRQDRIAGALTHTLDPSGRIPVEDGAIFGKGELARRLLQRIPI